MAGTSILSDCSFETLAEKGQCSSATVKALESLGYTRLSKIQLRALPNIYAKKNCYIHARTGSGKTIAFLLPALERLIAMKFKESHGVGALIISPTRELAQQTAHVVEPLVAAHGLTSLTLIGGKKDKGNLHKGATIVVGTPGKICKALQSDKSNCIPTKKLRILILDEADKLLDHGTHTDNLRLIYSRLPKEKLQKILVSATVTDECMKLAKEVLQEDDNFVHLSTEAESVPTTKQIKQSYISVKTGDRLSMLVTVLKTLQKKKILVFFNSCHSVKFHNDVLSHFDLPVMCCMGQDKQIQRSSAYAKFSEMKRGTLLTTGMAERGWDIPGVHWIIVYDPPHKPEDYIHRIGRTGRGDGKVGQALLFLRPEEEKFTEILHNMNVEISQIEFEGDLTETQIQITSLLDENKDLHNKAKTAYKKFVRAYQCHSLRRIFNIDTLDLTEVSKSFGFLKPPMYLGHLK